MLLSSQCMGTPAGSQTALQRLGKRLTRFWSKKGAPSTIAEIVKVCKVLE